MLMAALLLIEKQRMLSKYTLLLGSALERPAGVFTPSGPFLSSLLALTEY